MNNKIEFNNYLEKKIAKSIRGLASLKLKIKSNNDKEIPQLTNKIKKLEKKITSLKYSVKMYKNFLDSNKINDEKINIPKNDFVIMAKLITILNISHLYNLEKKKKFSEFEKIIKINQEMKEINRIIPNEYNKKMSLIFTLINNINKNEKNIREVNINHKYLINNGYFPDRQLVLKEINNKKKVNNKKENKETNIQNSKSEPKKENLENNHKKNNKKLKKKNEKNNLDKNKSVEKIDFKNNEEIKDQDYINDSNQKVSFLSKKLGETKLLFRFNKNKK